MTIQDYVIIIKSKHGGVLGKLELPLLLMRETRKRLKTRHYDFVYGLSEGSHMGVRKRRDL